VCARASSARESESLPQPDPDILKSACGARSVAQRCRETKQTFRSAPETETVGSVQGAGYRDQYCRAAVLVNGHVP
jgi:hypothetical protein